MHLLRYAPKANFQSRATHLARKSFATSSAVESSTQTHASDIRVGILLVRPPLLVKQPSELEAQYLLYRTHHLRTHSRPFATSFFYKPGSVGEAKWEEYERLLEGGNSLVGSFRQVDFDALMKGFKLGTDDVKVGPNSTQQPSSPTSTSSDSTQTHTSTSISDKDLNRYPTEKLVLVVKNKDKSEWEFPTTSLEGAEVLHEAAERHLSTLGPLEHWVVGKKPVGVFVDAHQDRDGKKVFYMKSHIIAGRLNESAADYKWLTKQELRQYLNHEMWKQAQLCAKRDRRPEKASNVVRHLTNDLVKFSL